MSFLMDLQVMVMLPKDQLPINGSTIMALTKEGEWSLFLYDSWYTRPWRKAYFLCLKNRYEYKTDEIIWWYEIPEKIDEETQKYNQSIKDALLYQV